MNRIYCMLVHVLHFHDFFMFFASAYCNVKHVHDTLTNSADQNDEIYHSLQCLQKSSWEIFAKNNKMSHIVGFYVPAHMRSFMTNIQVSTIYQSYYR